MQRSAVKRPESSSVVSVFSIALAAALVLGGPPPELEAQETRIAEGPPVPSGAAVAAAQPARSAIAFDLAIGLLTPLGDLTPGKSDASGDGIEPSSRLSTGLALAGGATYFVGPTIGVGLRASWSTADVDLTPGAGGGAGEDSRLGEADHVTASAELVYRFLGRRMAGLLDPYITAGAGVRHISFSFDDPALEDRTDPMATLAAGIRTPVGGRFYWRLELRDYLSVFEPADGDGELQNDLMVTVGFGAGL